MTVAEAKKYLKGIDYIPGTSKTLGMAPDKRAKVKKACRTLKDNNSLAAFTDEMTKAKASATAGK